MLNKEDYSFNLPKNLIAQVPISPRDSSRLLCLDKKSGEISHDLFNNLDKHLNKGDILVLNNSKVFPARLIGKKSPSQGKIEIFLLSQLNNGVWRALVKGRNIKAGQEIIFSKDLKAVIIDSQLGNKDKLVKFNFTGKKLMDKIFSVGLTPLPPYIKRDRQDEEKNELSKLDKIRYQTVYAEKNKLGSVAAPTAGLHFTNSLFKKLKSKGVIILQITLHVGLGTFLPLTDKQLKEKKLHQELIEIDKKTIFNLKKYRNEEKRIIAVGTTTARALEAVFNLKGEEFNQGYRGLTDIFIFPGYKFKIVNSMITNFHLPESSLIMLVSALAGKDNILKAYKEAIEKRYRFYSYGDAMMID